MAICRRIHTRQFSDSYHSTKCNNTKRGMGKRMRKQLNKKRRFILKLDMINWICETISRED